MDVISILYSESVRHEVVFYSGIDLYNVTTLAANIEIMDNPAC